MFAGSMVALVTPMDQDGQIDYDALQKLVELHIQAGTDALVAVGTTGESATLNVTEHVKVVREVVRYADGRIPVIAGTGANATAEAIELTQAVAKTGVAACLSVTPYYNKPTQEGLFQHYKAIAESTDLPQILYNVPGRTAVDMLPETVARLAKLDGIIGVKEATGDLSRLKAIQALCADEFKYYSGDDATALEFMREGGHGVISVTANVTPKLMADMCRFALNAEFEQAKAIDDQLAALHNKLFVEANPIPVKWAMAHIGMIPTPALRLPLTILSQQAQPEVISALKSAGL